LYLKRKIMELNNVKQKSGEVLTGTIRTRLLYRTREAMEMNWKQVFPNVILPDEHTGVPFDTVKLFLESMSVQKQGRSKAITNAAIEFLKELQAPLEVLELPFEDPANISSEVEPEAELPAKQKTDGEESKSWIKSVSALDVVFFCNMAVADYGLVYMLKEMGAAWAIVYTLVSFHALKMAKDRYSQVTASRGIAAVWVLEVFAFFIHLAMFNLRAWQAAKDGDMPFSPWENITYPFWIAFALAALFSGAAVYAVSTTLALTKEKVEAENYEETHGVKY